MTYYRFSTFDFKEIPLRTRIMGTLVVVALLALLGFFAFTFLIIGLVLGLVGFVINLFGGRPRKRNREVNDSFQQHPRTRPKDDDIIDI